MKEHNRKIGVINTLGTIYSKYVKCGKKGCHCYSKDPGHGPYFYLKFSNNKDMYLGKTLPNNFLEKREFQKQFDKIYPSFGELCTFARELEKKINKFLREAESLIDFSEYILENENDE